MKMNHKQRRTNLVLLLVLTDLIHLTNIVQQRPIVVINGMPLESEYNNLVLPSIDSETIFKKFHGTSESVAYYLAGPYATGKTNTLYQLAKKCRKEGYVVVEINGDLKMVDSKWELIEQGLLEIPFVKKYVSSQSPDISASTLQRVNTCTNAFAANKHTNNDMNVVICIDESQNFVALNKTAWNQTIREIVRGRLNTWVICATSSFDLFPIPEAQVSVDSPFSKDVFPVSYFTKDQIDCALSILQGQGQFFVSLESVLKMMTTKIFDETQGHPGLCAHYFALVREILNKISSTNYQFTTADIPKMWEFASEVLILANTRSFRLLDKMLEVNIFKLVEKSGLLYDLPVKFNNKTWEQDALRLGLGKLDSECKSFSLSCNIIRRLYLQAVARTTNTQLQFTPILSMCSGPGEIDLLEVVKYLFMNIQPTELLHKESWVEDRITKKPSCKGPSEKTYQNLFFTTLFSICNAPWHAVLEIISGEKEKGKCDLGLIYSDEDKMTKTKYLIELGVNLPNSAKKDNHTCEGHYNRQVEKYSEKNVAKSIVVMIYTNKHLGYQHFWPKKDSSQVQYIMVEHFLETTPYQISIHLSSDNHVVLDIPQGTGTY